MYQQGGPLPLQGRPSGLPNAMDRQFQSRVDPRLLSQQMPQQAMQHGGYQNPMYGGAMRQQKMQQHQKRQGQFPQQQFQQLSPQQQQQMSPQMMQQYQQQQMMMHQQQQQMRQQQMQQHAAMMAANQQRQLASKSAQMQPQQQQQPGYQQQFNPAMLPANGNFPSGPGNMGHQPQFDGQGNPVVPDALKAENTSIHGSGDKVNVGTYDQHDQYAQAKKDRNLNPKEHLLFVCPNKCKYSAAIVEYLSNNNLMKNFMVIDISDPRITGIPNYITSVPTLYKPLIQRKFTEDNLKKWLIAHFGDPTQAINGFKNGDRKEGAQLFGFIQQADGTKIVPKDWNLRPLGDITGSGNDIFDAMSISGAPLSNDPNKYEVTHTTILEGSLSKFDDINRGVHDFSFVADKAGRQVTGASGGFVTPGELRPSDKEDVYDPNANMPVQEPLDHQPGHYIQGNPFEIKLQKAADARKDEIQNKYQQLQQERAQDLKMRPSQQQQQQRAFKPFGY